MDYVLAIMLAVFCISGVLFIFWLEIHTHWNVKKVKKFQEYEERIRDLDEFLKEYDILEEVEPEIYQSLMNHRRYLVNCQKEL